MDETQVVEYNLTDAVISEMSKAYMGLTIKDLDDTAGFEAVHEARMVVKGKRIEVEKRRKELKADALAWGKLVDSKAKVIFGKIEPIETHLKTEEDKVTGEKKRIQEEKERQEKEKIDERVEALSGYGVNLPYFDVAAMTDEEYDKALLVAKEQHEAEQARIAKEEADRRAESERLKQERAELEKQKAEQDAAQKKIDDEKAAIEAEKKAEQEKKDRAEFERKAKENAEREAKEKAERDEIERIEREKAEVREKERQEALKPDKEKLLDFAGRVYGLSKWVLNLESEEARAIFHDILLVIEATADQIKKKVKAL